MKYKRFRTEIQIDTVRGNTLTVQVTGCIYPEEKEIRYFRDGSGCPGSPAYIEFDTISVLDYTGDFGTVERNDVNTGWFNILDDYAAGFEEYLSDRIFEGEEE